MTDERIARLRDAAWRKRLRGESAALEELSIAQYEERIRQSREAEQRVQAQRGERLREQRADLREYRQQQNAARAAREAEDRAEREAERRRYREQEEAWERQRLALAAIEAQEKHEEDLAAFETLVDAFATEASAVGCLCQPDGSDFHRMFSAWQWGNELRANSLIGDIDPEAFEQLTTGIANTEGQLARIGVQDAAALHNQMVAVLQASCHLLTVLRHVETKVAEPPTGKVSSRKARHLVERQRRVLGTVKKTAAKLVQAAEALGPKYVSKTKAGDWRFSKRFAVFDGTSSGEDPATAIVPDESLSFTWAEASGPHHEALQLAFNPRALDARIAAASAKIDTYWAAVSKAEQSTLKLIRDQTDDVEYLIHELDRQPIHFTDWKVRAALEAEFDDSTNLSSKCYGAFILSAAMFGIGELFDIGILAGAGTVTALAALGFGATFVIRKGRHTKTRGTRALRAAEEFLESLT